MLHLELWVKSLFAGGQKGMAMVTALIALTLGMLLITPVLSYVSTGVKAASIYKGATSELYAADAGVEYAMWCIKTGSSVSSPISLGGIPVTVSVSQLSDLPYGPVITGSGPQSWRLQVTTGLTNNGSGNFTYTVSVANVGTSTIHLSEIGSGLPNGYTYVTGSTSGDITSSNPSSINGEQLTWTLSNPKLDSGKTDHHIFHIHGSGTPADYYSWVVASVSSIGTVSSCFGYSVVSQANGGTIIKANVAKNQSSVYPVSWKVN